MQTTLRQSLPFVVPAFVVAAAALALSRIDQLPSPWHDLLPYAPYLLMGTALFLGYHFNRGRVVLAALLLITAYATCRTFIGEGRVDFTSRLLFAGLAFLIPVNLTILAFMKERGVLTIAGRVRLSFLAFQAGLIYWLLRYHYTGAEAFLNLRFINIPFLENAAIPHLALLAAQIGFACIVARIVLHKSPVDSGLLGCLIALAIAFNWPDEPHLFSLFNTAAGLILLLGILQDTHNLAFRDDLTGLPSRRALNEQLNGLGRQYVVAMLDVDHFKKFNDDFGHDVGDQVLKMVATKIHGVGGGGRPFRYGGEEFTVVFPRKRLSETLSCLEGIRRGVEAHQLSLRSPDRPKEPRQGVRQRGKGGGEKSVGVTISIGVAEANDCLATPAEVIKAADKALYRAKQAGRNQISR